MSALGDFAYNVATVSVGVIVLAVVLRILGWQLSVTRRRRP